MSALNILLGLATGFAAALLQLRLLAWGGIAPDQRLAYWAFFLALGACAGIAGWLVGRVVSLRWMRAGRTLAPIVALLAAGAIFARILPGNATPLPNVLLLVTDTTRADHLSLYGYDRPTTPYLEELREESIIFTNAFSQGSHTIVSTPSILASIYPSEHGVDSYNGVLADRFTLLPEHLKSAGYDTFGFVTNPHVSAKNGFDQGFDTYEMLGKGTSVAVHAPRVNRNALEWLDEREGDAPFFGFLFYTDPHAPYAVPDSVEKIFPPDPLAEPIDRWNVVRDGRADDAELANMVAQYDESIRYWDARLRDFTGELAARGMLENTVLVYTSDHGEEFWDHEAYGHGSALYDESIHVPLLLSFPSPVRLPRLPRARGVVEEVVSSVDLLPTILELLRLPKGEGSRGRSALPLVLPRLSEPDSGGERFAYCEELLTQYGPYDIRCLRTRARKFILILDMKGAIREHDDLLFDMENDPGETTNIIGRDQEESDGMLDRLALLINEHSLRAPEVVEQVELDEEHMEQLEALGYID
ncbi:MAG: sulfatase [Gemmatimonadota bacterium]|jgi:arylsulfatase|nr:hypothetical protein [Gemmatimonadota bacterium]MDP6461549.1 sulfatase [Gemmatimonadota bacterium]MDP6528136.1 sulfatase [Gemmatimonadota bacterium]MDP6801746.1 sulfatase [Gemmatimonadota bacterium]MDP7031178.1 sulfatase [Gemmatimonadota bacterium]